MLELKESHELFRKNKFVKQMNKTVGLGIVAFVPQMRLSHGEENSVLVKL